MTVVLDGQLQVAVFQLHHIQQRGIGAVHGEGVGVVSAVTDGAGFLEIQHLLQGQIAVHLIVFGHSHETDGEGVTFLEAAQLLGSFPNAQAGGIDIGPVAAVDIVVSRLQLRSGNRVDHIALSVFHIEQEAAGITDQRGSHIADLHGGTDGDLISRESLFHCVGVADEGDLVVILVEEGQIVGVSGIGIHKVRTVLGGVEVFLIGQMVIHGGIGPVAVEAQHGDGVGRSNLALFRDQGFHKNIAFHIGTVGVSSVQMCLGVVGQVHGHGDSYGITGRNQEVTFANGGQQQMCIVTGDTVAVADISIVRDLADLAGHIVQDDHGVLLVGDAVIVEIAGVHFTGGNIAAFDAVVDTHAQAGGSLVGISDAVDGDHILSEEITIDAVNLGFGAEVVQCEAEAVSTGTVGIIAQFHLDLTVGGASIGVGIHPQVGVGSDGIAHIGKACALLHHGIVSITVHHGHCGGHQQRGCQLAAGHTKLHIQTGLLDVLHDQSGHTGDLGRCHRGTGVVLVGSTGRIHTVHGVDLTAGSGNFGLHLQIAGNTPGAEITHHKLVADDGGLHLVGDVHGTLIADNAAILSGNGGGCVTQLVADCLAHGNGGSGVLVAVHVHDQSAFGVVVNDGGDKACIHSVGGLCAKVDHTSGADEHGVGRNGAADGFHGSRHIFGSTDAVHQNVVHITCHSGQRRQCGTIGEGTFGVEQNFFAQANVIVGETNVVGRSDRHGVGGGGRSGDHAVIHVFHIQQTGAVDGIVCPCAGVTGSHSHDNVVVSQAVQNVLILVVSDETLISAQGQIDHVTVQQNGVLDGDHIVGFVSTAGAAEYLHHDDLSIGSHTLHGHLSQRIGVAAGGGGDETVGRCDTGNMRTVVAHIVAVVIHNVVGIHIVDCKGDLLVDVIRAICSTGQVLHIGVHIQLRQNAGDLFLIQQAQIIDIFLVADALGRSVLLQGIQESIIAEALVIGIQASVDDRNPGACAGVSGCPRIVGTDHGGGSGHHGLCVAGSTLQCIILIFHEDILDTTDGRNFIHLAVQDIGGNDVGSQGHGPNHVQALPLQHIPLDSSDHRILLSLQLIAVSHGFGIVCHIHGGIYFQSCFLVQHNGDTDHIGILIGNLFFGLCDIGCVVKIVAVRVFHFGERKPGALVSTGHGDRFGCKCLDGTCTNDDHQCQEHGQKPRSKTSLCHI